MELNLVCNQLKTDNWSAENLKKISYLNEFYTRACNTDFMWYWKLDILFWHLSIEHNVICMSKYQV